MWDDIEELDVISEKREIMVEDRESVYIERAQRELERSNLKQAVKEFEKGYRNCKSNYALKREWVKVMESIIIGEGKGRVSRYIEEHLTNMISILDMIKKYKLDVDRKILKENLMELISLGWISEEYLGDTEIKIGLDGLLEKIDELKTKYYSLFKEEEMRERDFGKFDDTSTTSIKYLANKILWKKDRNEKYQYELQLLKREYVTCKDLEGYLLGRRVLVIVEEEWEKYKNIKSEELVNKIFKEYREKGVIQVEILEKYINERYPFRVDEIENILESLGNVPWIKEAIIKKSAEKIYKGTNKESKQVYAEIDFVKRYNLDESRYKDNIFRWLKSRCNIINIDIFQNLSEHVKEELTKNQKMELIELVRNRSIDKTKVLLKIFMDCENRDDYKFICVLNMLKSGDVESGLHLLSTELKYISFNEKNKEYTGEIVFIVKEENKELLLIEILKKYYKTIYSDREKEEVKKLISELSIGAKEKIKNFFWIKQYGIKKAMWERRRGILVFIVFGISIMVLVIPTYIKVNKKARTEEHREIDMVQSVDNGSNEGYYDADSSLDYYDDSSSDSCDSDYRRDKDSRNTVEDSNKSKSNRSENEERPKLKSLTRIDTDVYTGDKINKPEYNSGTYMFGNSYQEYLTDADLDGLSENTLNLLRNEIYAKNGIIYNSEPYKSYFESKKWYKPTRKEIPDSDLNIYEKKNIKLILKHEQEQQNNSRF